MFSPKLTDNANVNLTKLGERFISMTETPIPVEFDAETLAAAGVPYKPPGQLSTAHPHMDRATKGMLNYAAKLGPRTSYRFFLLRPGSSKPEVIATKPVREPAYMHSFGLTERWLVLAEFPFVVNPPRLAFSGRPYIENYRWKPELGTRFHLFDRATGESVGPFETEARFGFHHVNSYEEDGEVVVDICTFPDAGIVEDLYLERLRAGKPVAPAHLERFRISPEAGTVSSRAADRRADRAAADQLRQVQRAPLPLRVGRRHRGAAGSTGSSRPTWSSAARPPGPRRAASPASRCSSPPPTRDDEDEGVLLSVVLDGRKGNSFLLVLDARSLDELARAEVPHHIPFGFHGHVVERRSTTWSEENCFPGEPVFVAAPDADDEGEGVLLSIVLDGRKGNSFLLVLDARSLDELARAEVPHHIPFGFHGQFARG